MRKIRFALSIVSALLLAGCSLMPQVGLNRGGNPGPTLAPAVSGASTPGGIPATGNQPAVTVNDQASDGTSVVVGKVISKGPGWIAIHAQQTGQVGEVIGYAHLNDGENDNVTVKVDPTKVTSTLYAMLHVDAGQIGVYEFPGPDVPFMLNGQMVSPSFNITKAAAASLTPSVSAKDQDVSSGKVTIDDAVSIGPGWVDIHIENPDGTIGPEIGYTAVHNGDNRNITVIIDASKATPTLHAILHIDAGTPGVFEGTGADNTVMLNGQKVGAAFKNSTGQAASVPSAMPGMDTTPNATGQPAASPYQATMQPPAPSQPTASSGTGMVMMTPSSGGNAPRVKVSDQPVQNGTVKIDDVVSAGPGWIVVYTVNTSGQPDQPIGYAHVNDGDNPNVIVKIDTTKPVDTLYAQLHVDAGTVGTFEFPGLDAPVMMGVQMISGLFHTNANAAAAAPTANSAPTPEMVIHDQAIHNGALVVSHVVADAESWVVIHRQNPNGEVGEFIGATPVHAGVTDNVIVHIDPSRATRVMWGMLHVDVSKASYPQFPGVDVPVMVGGQMVLPQFNVVGPLGGDIPLAVSKNSNGVSYLTDGLGMSLYLSLNDQPGVSNCTGDCLKQWHPLLATGVINPGNGVAVGKIGVIFLPDHTRQITYGGSPLYYFTGDQNPGDTKGQGQNGSFFLVTP